MDDSTQDLGGEGAQNVADSGVASDAAREGTPVEEALVSSASFSREEQIALVEAILVSSPEPIAKDRIAEVAALSIEVVEEVLSSLRERCSSDSSGVELIQVAGRMQFRTKARFASFLRQLKEEPPRRLTGAALETLAIVAYRQPIVRSDIEKIRGVDCTPTLKTLLDRGIIKIVGHQSTVGQPALYGTTEDFLELFGLNSLSELPTLRDLQEVDSDPGETEERAETAEETAQELSHTTATLQ